MTPPQPPKTQSLTLRQAAVFALVWTFSLPAARSQESLRLSLAGADAAQARHQAAATPGYYNLKLGPTAWSLSAGLSAQADDNIQLVETNPKADLIFAPEIRTRMAWPVSEVNSLNLAMGAGYQAYVFNPAFSRFYVTPGSEASFDVYAGDFWINVHDRFYITQNTYQDPTVVGSADYSRLENAAGASVLWDLNKLVLKLGYDHVNYVSLQGTPPSSGGQPDGASEVFYASGASPLRPGRMLGLEVGGTLIHYNPTPGNPTFTQATQWGVGPYFEGQLTEYIRGRVDVGYTVFTPEATAPPSTATALSGVYAQVAVQHRLNRFLDYRLTGGRTITFTFYGGTVDLYYARLQANWNILRNTTLNTSFEYEHGTQLSFGTEIFERYGPAISLGRAFNARLSGQLAYQFYWRGSDQPGRDYTVNLLTLSATYRF